LSHVELGQFTHANAIIELIDNAVFLVARCIVLDRKGRVVGADFGDVAVLPVAKFWIVVAWHCVRRNRGAARRSPSVTAPCNNVRRIVLLCRMGALSG
jgi:hypothetical protein